MTHFDLCLSWYWEYDTDFVRLIESACQARGLSVIQVTPQTLQNVVPLLEAGQITFATYLDRSDHEPPFEPVFRWARDHPGCYRINPREAAAWAEDKATMHLELISAGLTTPYTIILPPFNEQPHLPGLDLSPLGERFVIKPCYGGGGEGVIMGATSIEHVLARRIEFPHLKYLLQQTITARRLDGRDAWFRIIFCDGQFYPCWWDTQTHIYASVTADEESRHGLTPLRDLTARIAALCKLGFFSTEIAFTADDQWVIIDYVNDQIDMRLQSKALDGVPDGVVEHVSHDLAQLIEKHRW
jgi:hypothetical protein